MTVRTTIDHPYVRLTLLVEEVEEPAKGVLEEVERVHARNTLWSRG